MSRSINPVDHVLNRMVEAALGENAYFRSYADALGIPPNTIRTWRQRGAVPPGTLANFAADWKISVDWLLHGDQPADPAPTQARAKVAVYADLTPEERSLIENYRASPPEVREALQLVAGIASRPRAGVSPAAKARAPRHAGAVEPVSRGSGAGHPARKRGAGKGTP